MRFKEFFSNLFRHCIPILANSILFSAVFYIFVLVDGKAQKNFMGSFISEFLIMLGVFVGSYIALQFISFATTKKFFYTSLLADYPFLPTGYKHDRKDIVFTLIHVVVLVFIGLFLLKQSQG